MQDWQHLQPLRIPSGWTIMINKLEDIEPEELSPEDKIWLYAYTEDILYMYTNMSRKKNKELETQTLVIDLGWYPDSDPKGTFRLLAILNDNWENPLLEFSSRKKKEVVKKLERWLFDEFMPRSYIEEELFRRNHMPKK